MMGELQLDDKTLKVCLMVHKVMHAVEYAEECWTIFKFQVCFNKNVYLYRYVKCV